MKRLVQSLSIVLALTVAGASASAGTISGTIRAQSNGAALSGIEVRAWEVVPKGLSLAATTTTNSSGNYTLTVSGGTYKVDARGGTNYGDRWYDVAAPTSGGYVAENADHVIVAAAGSATGIDISLEVFGGADGRVTYSGSGLGACFVRIERNADPRIHHTDLSEGNPVVGRFSFRGVPPANDYQIFIYDPSGNRADRLVGGPYTITSGNNISIGDVSMSAAPADPYEGNNTGNCTNTLVDEAALHMSTPQPWQTSGARIGPRGSDPDWYCVTAVEGDRFLVSVSTAFSFGGMTRYHPNTDPILSFWRGAGGTKLVEDDDSGGGYYDAYVDTGPLAAGCHCAAVSTFGDPDYNGSGQGSSGRYTLRFEMGNRPQLLKVFKGTTEVPSAPQTLVIAENQELALNIEYPDADGDTLSTSFTHTDDVGVTVTGGTLSLGASNGTYTWMAGPTAAANSPYTIVVTAADAEFTRTKTIQLVVTAVNDPPDVPTLISPINGATAAPTPTLTIGNATDPDGDSLSYDIELYYFDTNTAPAQSGTVAETFGGQTSWVAPVNIAENTRVFWRARANDGVGGISAWTDFGEFLVDSANDPPDTPVLIKPTNGELLVVRRPGLSVINVVDPEDDAIEFVFEIASDSAFNNLAWTSAPVPQSTAGGTTMAASTQDLSWGGTYYARARAIDARGGMSDWSNVREFRLKTNQPPGTPSFTGGCAPVTYTEATPTSIEVDNVVDPEAEQVVFELEIFPYDAPATGSPLISANQAMAVASQTTEIAFDGSALENGRYRYRVRAFDGTDYSEWIECDFTVEIPEGEASGGCCRSSAPGGGAWLLGTLVLAVLFRRRRR